MRRADWWVGGGFVFGIRGHAVYESGCGKSCTGGVSRARKAAKDADGIWIFTPEYNAAVPGALKNLLDWLSRPLVVGNFSGGTAVMKKKVTISGAGGKNATRSARHDLKKLLDFMRMEVIFGEGTGFALDGAAFASDALSLNEESSAELSKQAAVFLSAV